MIIMNYLQGGSRREREIRGNGTAMEVFESHGIGANFLLRHSSSSSSSSSQTITITSSNTNIEDGKEGNSRASQQRIVQWWTHSIILILNY